MALKFESEILEIKQLAADTKEFTLTAPEEFTFEPGQFIMLFIEVNGNLEKRAYTIVNLKPNLGKAEMGPAGQVQLGDNKLTLCIKKVENGLVSPAIHELKVNDKVTIQGPFAGFKLKNNDAVFIAVGVGITPFISMIPALLKRKKKIILLVGQKYENELIYDDYFKGLDIEYHVVISRDEKYKGEKGHVQDLIEKYVPKDFKGDFYICGMPKMMNDIKELLIKKGFNKDRIV